MKCVGSLLSAGCLFVLTSAEPGLRGGVGEVVAEEAPKSLAEARRGEDVTEEAPESLAEASRDVDEHSIGDAFPDVTSGLDVAGPYLEEPHEDEAASPRPAKVGWDNATSMQAAGVVDETWGGSFCTVHKTGFFCDGTTRVRCCKKTWGFVKCGTTVHSSSCGWHVGLNAASTASAMSYTYKYKGCVHGHNIAKYTGKSVAQCTQICDNMPACVAFEFGRAYGGSGVYRPGDCQPQSSADYAGCDGGHYNLDLYIKNRHIPQAWSPSSFCVAHHTGFFCTQHKKVHCCNDFGTFVDCTVVHQEISQQC